MSRKTSTGEKLEQHTTLIPETSCIVWTGSVNEHGYGYLREGNKMVRAHKASYLLNKGPIQDGLVVCHLCDVPACVNPDHLYLGTQQENILDCSQKGRFVGRSRRGKKMSNKTIIEIYGSQMKHADIALEYGCSLTMISRIKSKSVNPIRFMEVAS